MKFTKDNGMIRIWGDVIPGNTGRSKNDIMHWDDSISQEDMFVKYPGVWDKSTEVLGDMKGNDTMVYREEIKDGYAEEIYDDVPFLMPYLVPGSDKCVIACPGGAYLTKSIKEEGEDIAEFLNTAGISVFILWYRSYPYDCDYYFMDLQRAIRYVRFHASEYGINPNKIATVGFSAGGNLVAVEATIVRNAPVTCDGYVEDEVDKVSAMPNGIGLIYPALSMRNDKLMVPMAGAETYNDSKKREAFADKMDVVKAVRENDAPVFIANAVDDEVIDAFTAAEFAKSCKEKGVQCELHMFPYGGHGFGGCKGNPNPFAPSDFTAVYLWKDLFANWVNRTLK